MISIEQMMFIFIESPISAPEDYFLKDDFIFQTNHDSNLLWVRPITKLVYDTIGLVIEEKSPLFAFYNFHDETIYKNLFNSAIKNSGFRLFEDNNYNILVNEKYTLFFVTNTVDGRTLFSVILGEIKDADFSQYHFSLEN